MDFRNRMRNNSEPSTVSGTASNLPQPNTQPLVPPPGNAANFNMHQIPEHIDGGFYGLVPYNGIPNRPAAPVHGFALDATPNYYSIPVMPPPAMVPIGQNYSPLNHFSSPNNHGYVGLPVDQHGRDILAIPHFIVYKRKIRVVIPGSVQAVNPSAGSASLVGPSNPVPYGGFVRANSSYLAVHPPRGNRAPVNEARVSYANMSGGSVAVGMDPNRFHNHNHLSHGFYFSPPFPPASTGAVPSWNQLPVVPYMPEANLHGVPMEVRGLSFQGYHESSSFPIYLHSPPINQQFHNLQHPPPYPMQVVRDEFPLHPFGPGISYPPLPNNALGSVVPYDRFGMGVRQSEAGRRTHRAQGGVVIQEATPNPNLSHDQNVAVLDSPDNADQHRDLRLDIEGMSYEELLTLGEQIGTVSTGLSEETINRQLKTRTYQPNVGPVNMDEVGCLHQEPDSCIICQDIFTSGENIAILDCGHEYHADCLKRWLCVKNACPICKVEALTE